MCPRKYREAEVDHGSVQRVAHLGQLQCLRLVLIDPTHSPHQHFGHGCKYSPVPVLISISNVGASRLRPEPGMISALGLKTGGQIAQAFAMSQMGKDHREKMIVS